MALMVFVSANVSCTQLSGIATLFKPERPFRGNNSPLSPLSQTQTGVGIDVFVIRVPYDRRELFERFWNDVFENEIPIETRNRLYQNGLRQGMLSAKIPVSLERLLDLKDIPPQNPFIKVSQAGPAALGEPLFKRFEITMLQKQPVEFPTCDTIPKLPVLAMVDGKPAGKVYENACGKILITTDEQPDGSVLVKTVPEIHFGAETREITAEHGAFRPRVFRSKIQFDQLAVETKLLLGQWVVIGPETRHRAGFGRDILSQGDGDKEQILIGIRLRQTQKDGIHDRNGIAVLKISDDTASLRSDNDGERQNVPRYPASLADQEMLRAL